MSSWARAGHRALPSSAITRPLSGSNTTAYAVPPSPFMAGSTTPAASIAATAASAAFPPAARIPAPARAAPAVIAVTAPPFPVTRERPGRGTCSRSEVVMRR